MSKRRSDGLVLESPGECLGCCALRADLQMVVARLLRIRRNAEHYYETGNKHRNLKAIREEATRTASTLVARHPWIAKELNDDGRALLEEKDESCE